MLYALNRHAKGCLEGPSYDDLIIGFLDAVHITEVLYRPCYIRIRYGHGRVGPDHPSSVQVCRVFCCACLEVLFCGGSMRQL
jgi:hypothetical protein